jgi:hypothetical protein
VEFKEIGASFWGMFIFCSHYWHLFSISRTHSYLIWRIPGYHLFMLPSQINLHHYATLCAPCLKCVGKRFSGHVNKRDRIEDWTHCVIFNINRQPCLVFAKGWFHSIKTCNLWVTWCLLQTLCQGIGGILCLNSYRSTVK